MRGYETRIWKDVITMLVTRGMAAVLQSSVEWVELSSAMKVYYFASPEEVLDEGEGLDVVENFLNLGGAPVGGCDGVKVAALSRRRPPMHVILI